MSKQPAPPLLPILRSAQQASVLAWLLDDPSREVGVSELSRYLRIPQPSVSRDVAQAQRAGILNSRTIGRNRLISANEESVYFRPLRELLVLSFGPPGRLRSVLEHLRGVERVFIFGSWAARYFGQSGSKQVGDIDVLVLGSPVESEVYAAVMELRSELKYEIQVTIRPNEWLENGKGSFHDTLVSRPIVSVLDNASYLTNGEAASIASAAH